jgi:hypothetical protein
VVFHGTGEVPLDAALGVSLVDPGAVGVVGVFFDELAVFCNR